MSAQANGERIPMFRDSAKESLELVCSRHRRFTTTTILRLTDFAHRFSRKIRRNDPMVKQCWPANRHVPEPSIL